MIKLEKEFVSGVGGFAQSPLTYKQIIRSDTAAVYERSRDGQIKDYEAISIRIIPKGTSIFNQPASTEDEEHYPSTNQFGKMGFHFHGNHALQAAMKKFEELKKESIQDIAEENHLSVKQAIVIPIGKFSTKELAEKNNTNYITAANFIKDAVGKKQIKFVCEERRNVKGKLTKLYTKAK